MFHGASVPLHLPAGLAALSAYGDLTHSMPSWLANAEKDYMPPTNPTLLPNFPKCKIWPTKPPRVNALCNDTVLHHPLVSPVAVADWTGFPPLWLCYGAEEMMVDEGKFIAQRASQCGVSVVWEQYGAMPHCFALLPRFNRLPQVQKVFGNWANFCRTCVEQPKAISAKGTFTEMDDLREREVDVGGLINLSFEEVKHRMEKARLEAVELLARRECLSTKL